MTRPLMQYAMTSYFGNAVRLFEVETYLKDIKNSVRTSKETQHVTSESTS